MKRSEQKQWSVLAATLGTLGLGLAGCGEPDLAPPMSELPRPTTHHCQTEEAFPAPTGDFSATVTRYEFDFNLATGAALSRLLLHVPPPGGDCYVVNAPAGVSNVKWNGHTPRSIEQLEGALRVCGAPMFAGQVQLEARFTVPEMTYDFTQVGFSRRPDRHGNPFSYLLNWVESCDRFGPCDDRTDQQAHYIITVTHDPAHPVLCPGNRYKPSPSKTVCELTGLRAPTYSSFAIASNPAWVVPSAPFASGPGFQLFFYEAPGGRLASSLESGTVTAYMQWITQKLGPLPYGTQLRVAGAPTEWLGQEHPGNIILREDLPDLRRDYANMTLHTLMHEVVHQWAGNLTTLTSPSDFAWKEAIAEYLTYVYEESHRPANEAAQTRVFWDRLARSATYYPKPQDDPPPHFLSFASDVYGTGPMLFFLQLEPLLGQDTVIAGIQHFLRAPGHRSVENLRESLETVSGQQLGTYFDAWVYGSGDPDWPYFDVSTQEMDGQILVTAAQQSYSGTLYPVSVDVLLIGTTQTQKVTLNYGLAPTTDTVSVTVPFSEPVVQVVVDPESRVVNRRFPGLIAEPPPQSWLF